MEVQQAHQNQRDIINERRQKLLTTDAAWEDLSYHDVDKANELKNRGIEQAVLEQAAREVMLFHLDSAWSDHLAYLDDIRESIHLRAIARESPIDEFHRMSIAAFKDLAESAVEGVRRLAKSKSMRTARTSRSLGLHKPSATWTYMVNDNPLSSGGGSVVGSIAQMFR